MDWSSFSWRVERHCARRTNSISLYGRACWGIALRQTQTGAWRPREFGSRKYVLRRLTADDRDEKKSKWWPLFKDNADANWAFFNYGEADPMPVASCVQTPDATLSEFFQCRPGVGSAKLDSDMRRFEMICGGGYIDQGFGSSDAAKTLPQN
jgi:hypothetical protein